MYKIAFLFLVIIFIIAQTFYIISFKNHKHNIPLNIYQTWFSKELPPILLKYNNMLKKSNQEFVFYLYDDNDCYEFIKNNFDKSVSDAYNKLVPGAYKADLWRYCILYIKGGIYLDIKYYTINNFKLITLTDKEYFVKDRYKTVLRPAIYNGLMICNAGNKILLDCINEIVKNVNTNYYGNSTLEVTGPLLLIKYMKSEDVNKIQLKYSENGKYILLPDPWGIWKDKRILQIYSEYRDDQKLYSKKQHYGFLWNNRSIYN